MEPFCPEFDLDSFGCSLFIVDGDEVEVTTVKKKLWVELCSALVHNRLARISPPNPAFCLPTSRESSVFNKERAGSFTIKSSRLYFVT